MKRGFFSIILTIVLVVAIIVVPMLTVREPNSVVTDKTIQSLSATLLETKPSETTKTAFQPNELVTFIIELTTDGLLDNYNAQNINDDIEIYALSNDGLAQLQEIVRQQALVRAEIKRTVTEADFAHTKSYKTVINGFTVRAYYSSLAMLKAIKGVKAVYLSYEQTMPQDDENNTDEPINEPQAIDHKTLLNYSYQDMIGANKNSDYTGTGVRVAVLDTAFDTNHEVFTAESGESLPIQFYWDYGWLSIDLEEGVDALYYNSKIIYGYDYAEEDVQLYSDSVHGTAVAGLIAGDNQRTTENTNYFGIAKTAELMLFKVANDELVIKDDVLLAALDDAAVLGADIINMSLNTERRDTNDTVFNNRFFERLFSAGVFVSVAAGNTTAEQVQTSTVDYGSTGMYATSSYAFVSSTVQNVAVYRYALIVNNQEAIVPTAIENAVGESSESVFEGLAGIYEYRVIESEKDISDFGYMELAKQIIIYNDSELTQEQLDALTSHGASAVLIVGEQTTPLENLMLPVAAIKQDYANYFAEYRAGTIDINTQTLVTVDNSEAWTAGAVYGTTDDLKMGMDAVAPSGEIYVPVYGNKYAVLGGSSMAAAEVSGAAAVLKSYLETSELANSMSRKEKNEWIYAQLISTAKPIQAGDSFLSPRIEGSGLIQLQQALENKTYLTVAGILRPKSEHGAFIGNSYAFAVRIENTADTDVSYRFEKILQTDMAVDIEGISYKSNEMVSILEYADFTIKQGLTTNISTISVPAHSWVDISATITLDKDFIMEQMKTFENGFFVDGYLRLLAADEDGIDLTIPFMSFYGAWSATSVLAEDENQNNVATLYSVTYDENSHNYVPIRMGFNTLTGERTENLIFSNSSYINYLKAIKRLNDHTYKTTILVPSILTARTAEQMTVNMSSFNGTVIYTADFNLFRTDTASAAGVIYQQNKFPQLKEGAYCYTVEVDSSLQSESTKVEFAVTVDKTAPKTADAEVYAENNHVYLKLTAEDNTAVQGFLMYAAVYDAKNKKYNYVDCLQTLIQEKIISEEAVRLTSQEMNEKSCTFIYDITQLKAALEMLSDEYRTKCGIMCSTTKIIWGAVDYAWNLSELQTTDTEPSGTLTLQFKDENGKAVSGVKAQISDSEWVSDENGEIYVQDLSLATYAVYITSSPIGYLNNAVFEVAISVDNIAPCQRITLNTDGFTVSEYKPTVPPSQTSEDLDSSEADKSNEEIETDRSSSFLFAWLLIAVLLVLSILALILSRRNRLGK